jgi:hypothetical protein
VGDPTAYTNTSNYPMTFIGAGSTQNAVITADILTKTGLTMGLDQSDSAFKIQTGPSRASGIFDGPNLTITSAGRVGVGTSTPSEALDVNGFVRASSGLKVPSSGTPGFAVIKPGNDSASLGYGDGANLILGSWWGVGFCNMCPPDVGNGFKQGLSHVFDCRTGNYNAAGTITSTSGFKVGSTTVVDSSGNIDGSRISGSVSATDSSKLPLTGGTITTGQLFLGSTALTNGNELNFTNGSNRYHLQQIDNGGANWFRIGRYGSNDIVISETGSVTMSGNLTVATSAQVRGASSIASQGAYIQWNKDNSQGRTYIINQKGGGTGGFIFAESDSSDNLTERVRISETGRVGIGTTTPSDALDVNGRVRATSGILVTRDVNMGFTPNEFQTHAFQLYDSNYSSNRGMSLLMGADASNLVGYIQAIQPLVTVSSLVLNPRGGGVGVGISSVPTEALDVGGFVRASSGLKVGSVTVVDSSGRLTSFGDLNARGSVYALTSNLATGNNVWMTVGKETTANNTANFRYTHSSNGSSNNYVGIGFWNNDDILNVTASGRVGIGSTNFNHKLHVVDQTNAVFQMDEYHNDDGAVIRCRRARGSLANPVSVKAGDVLMGLRGFGYTTASNFSGRAASIDFIAAQEYAAGSNGTHITFQTTTPDTSTCLERVRITDAGNVGINTATPSEALDVDGYVRASYGLKVGASTTPNANYNIIRRGPDAPGTLRSEDANLILGSWQGIGFSNICGGFIDGITHGFNVRSGDYNAAGTITSTNLTVSSNLTAGDTAIQNLYFGANGLPATASAFGGALSFNNSGGNGGVDYFNIWQNNGTDGHVFWKIDANTKTPLLRIKKSASLEVYNTATFSSNVTLGGTSFNNALQFDGTSSDNRVYTQNASGYTGVIHHVATGSNWYMMHTGGNVRMMVNSSGNVGVRTSSPSEALDVTGFVKASSGFKVGSTTVVDSSGNIDAGRLASGTVATARLPSASTSAAGVVQLYNNIDSTSTTLAVTANAVKTAYDLAAGKLNTSGGTMTGALTINAATSTLSNSGDVRFYLARGLQSSLSGILFTAGANGYAEINNVGTDLNLNVSTTPNAYTNRIKIKGDTGYVGINTATPAEVLDVTGFVRGSSGFKVPSAGTPGFAVIKPGNDTASLGYGDGANLILGSWYGVGFCNMCPPDVGNGFKQGLSHVFDCRTGNYNAAGTITSTSGFKVGSNTVVDSSGNLTANNNLKVGSTTAYLNASNYPMLFMGASSTQNAVITADILTKTGMTMGLDQSDNRFKIQVGSGKANGIFEAPNFQITGNDVHVGTGAGASSISLLDINNAKWQLNTTANRLSFIKDTNGTFDSTAVAQLDRGGNIYINGTVATNTSPLTVSDRRLKSNITKIDAALDKVAVLEGCTFDIMVGDESRRETGLIAQDVQAVLPEAVRSVHDDGMLSLAYGNLAGLFVEAIKELRSENAALRASLAALEAKVDAISPCTC